MTTSPFAPPASAAAFDYATHLGRLLVIEPGTVETGVQTTLGEKDAIRADVHVIDTQPPTSYEDVLIFPRVLQGQLRPRLGQMVLGRLEQGVAKPGQNPPWRIAEAGPADQATGAAWHAARQRSTFAQPAQAQPPAAPQYQAPAQPQYAPVPAQPQYQPPTPAPQPAPAPQQYPADPPF